MNSRSTLLTLMIAALLATNVLAQGPRPDPARVEAMKALEFLVGTWEGEGWIAFGPGQRNEFRGREIVELRLEGTVMVIEGIHQASSPGVAEPITVHHALAVVSPDGEGGYDFRSWLFNREGGEFKGRVEDGAFVWKMTTPRGEMRYTIRLDDRERWHEIGEFQGEDEEWRQFFEMTLLRVSEPRP